LVHEKSVHSADERFSIFELHIRRHFCSTQAATLICTCVLSVVSASPQYNNNRNQYSGSSGQGSYGGGRSAEASASITSYNNDQNFNGDYKYR
jgi:hypothetical protein